MLVYMYIVCVLLH